MRKLFSALAVVLVFAMAFTITASANTDTVYPLGSDGYSITCTDDSIKAGDMVGMVVIGAANPNYKVIDENTIRYIDQTTAGTNGSISFPSFKPMDLKTDETMYLVYIGGGELPEAKKMGSLARAATGVTLDVTSKTLTVGDSANGSVELTARVLPEGATYTAEWTSSVPTVATVVADATNTNKAVVTAVGAGDTVITVKVADGKTATCNVHVELPPANGIAINKTETTITVGLSETLKVSLTPNKAEKLPNGETPVYKWSSSDTTGIVTVDNDGKVTVNEVAGVDLPTTPVTITVTVEGYEADANFTKTCAVTVSAQPVGVPGDTDDSGELDVFDALRICQYLANWDVEINLDVADVDGSGELDVFDALRICQYLANWDVTLE